jgi:hypothetical protein
VWRSLEVAVDYIKFKYCGCSLQVHYCSVTNIMSLKISLRVRKRKYRKHQEKYQKITENVGKTNIEKYRENIAGPPKYDKYRNVGDNIAMLVTLHYFMALARYQQTLFFS